MTTFARSTMGRAWTLALAVALLAPAGGPLQAQRAGTPAQPGQPAAPGRAAQEQRLRQRLAAIVREELGLDDAQARQLGEASGRFERERRELARRERDLRLQLRDELQDDSVNQDRVARAIDRLLAVQRTRLDIVEREQRELARFLTPVQRARYLALQDQVRRRLEEARRDAQAPAGRRRPGAVRPRAQP